MKQVHARSSSHICVVVPEHGIHGRGAEIILKEIVRYNLRLSVSDQPMFQTARDCTSQYSTYAL